ncbi:MAG TPA: cell division protein ZapE [Gammaproteobacteria bacterium]|nr:AFG1 family ATPase [Xanthomonadales bacterium]HOP22992.1 cell division protein ZapE [Gammaproteobacteria bacterium]HPQ86319.1 cell division protein ZapE [Gammaproteobacteria bacterium]
MSPLKLYQKLVSQGEISKDSLQEQVVLAFENIRHNLHKESSYWFFKPKRSFNGLYIYGSVGRGKTFLMDLFIQTIDEKRVRRQHFHSFMKWLHQQLRQIKNQQNPLDTVIKDLSEEIDVLCLDEFLVHDITDAMLLAGILFAMQKYNISIITTSNVNPKDLYLGGLQREKFLPAISWMQQNMTIIQLDGEHDYRTADTTSSQQKWLSPINKHNETLFESRFSQLVGADDIHISAIEINKRKIEVIKRSDKYIMLEFEVLCMQPRNASDYIQLAEKYQTIFIVINHAIDKEDRNTARRFITLIDVLYDTNTPLYALSTVSFDEIYQGNELSFEMQRTVSRLTEQSQ